MVNIDQYISVFKDWCDKDIFSRLFKSVQNPDLQEVMLDSTIARAHACATGYDKDDNQAIGRSVGRITTKIHAMTDALGNPIEILLSEDKTHDSKVAIDLLKMYIIQKLSLIEHIILMKSGSIFKVYPLKLLSLVNQIL
ncbi:putative transposase [Francisella tularensis]|nr:putative transposase [Francisella tularensis]